MDEACWKGYTARGIKKKGGRMVPNCVPTNEVSEKDLGEAKGKFVYDKPLKAHVAAMDKKDTADLKGMHDRWSGDHKDLKSNPAHSERLLAVHHVLRKRGESVPDLPKHKNLGMTKQFTEQTQNKPPFEGPFRKADPAKQPARSRLKAITKKAREAIAKSSSKKSK